MKKKLVLTINAGKTTCASAPGKFCRFLGATHFGTEPVCMLFPAVNPGHKESGTSTSLKEKDGWLQRCPACLKAEQGA